MRLLVIALVFAVAGKTAIVLSAVTFHLFHEQSNSTDIALWAQEVK